MNWDKNEVPEDTDDVVFDGLVAATVSVPAVINVKSITINTASGTNAQALTLGGGFTITTNFTLNVTNSSIDFGANTVNVRGNFSETAGTLTEGTSTVIFDGSGAQTVSATTLNNVTISKSAGTLASSGILVIAGTLTMSSGTWDPGSFNHQINSPWDDTGITFTPIAGTITLTSVNPNIKREGVKKERFQRPARHKKRSQNNTMAIIQQKQIFVWSDIEDIGDLERFELILEAIPDEELMRKLERWRRDESI